MAEAPPLHQLRQKLPRVATRDQHRLRQRLRSIEQKLKRNQPQDKPLAELAQAVEHSLQRIEQRRGQLPPRHYDDELPIAAERHAIARAIEQHQVVIVCGDTGSGKSTQLPKICLDAGRGLRGQIGHTQPRRLAARSLAHRLSDELARPLGQAVGYKVRFQDRTSPQSFIKLMTDGILLAETQHDRFLDHYDTLILDEAHERSLNIDFLIGYLHRLLPKRPDLKLIITSATIDPHSFAAHFRDRDNQPAPVIEVAGRTYPVDVRYRPLETESPDEDDRDMLEGVAEAVEELARGDSGDVLVFLPTERDIREATKLLQGRLGLAHHGRGAQGGVEILPLYARLSQAEQNRIFQPHPGRRIVLATNVAETSLTVPGIRHVVDTGLARISRYSARAGVQRLPIEPVAKASADQRKGRCGRTAPGICIRLYGEDDYNQRETFTPPEILRTNLASVILQMKALRLGRIEDFPLIDPPKPAMIRAGRKTLFELGAIDRKDELTELGQVLAKLPVDPRIGRMILASDQENCLSEMLIIASALEVQEPRLRPPEKQQQADTAHERFLNEHSDFLSHLKLWDFYHEQKRKLSHNKLRLACQENFISPLRMREWVDVHRQLRELAKEQKLRFNDRKDEYESIHRALLTGLIANVAARGRGVEYQGAGGKQLYLWPGSALFAKKPDWIIAAEQIETTKLYARTVGRIKPEWIEPIAEHLLSRAHSQPWWDAATGHVRAHEKVSLYGLTIIPKRPVHFGPIDPKRARELFIHHALVEADAPIDAPFFEHNRQLVEKVRRLEAKLRQPDLLAEQEARYAFYDARVPEGVHNVPDFEKWRGQAERENPHLLYMRESDLLLDQAAAERADSFPDRLDVRGQSLPLDYELNPGEPTDGPTLNVPLAMLNQLDPRQLDWAVPGQLEEKVLALIRSLPKSIRKTFVPAPDYARRAVEQLPFGQGRLIDALAQTLGKLGGVQVRAADFRPEALPPHLHVNVRAVDEQGQTLEQDRDLDALRARLGAEAEPSLAGLAESPLATSGQRDWPCEGELPKTVDVAHGGGVTVKGHPAIVDEGESVGVRVFDAPEQARDQHPPGLRRLFYFHVQAEVEHRVRQLPGLNQLQLYAAPCVDAETLLQHIGLRVAERAFLDREPDIRTPAQFEQRLNAGWNRLSEATPEVARHVSQIFAHYHKLTLALEEAKENPTWKHAVASVRDQMRHLMHERFLAETPWLWLQRYPRYLAGAIVRLQKLRQNLDRDRHQEASLRRHWQPYLQTAEAHRKRRLLDPELEHLRWMIEEYRIFLFAQELGTAMKVSDQKLTKQWEKVRQ